MSVCTIAPSTLSEGIKAELRAWQSKPDPKDKAYHLKRAINGQTAYISLLSPSEEKTRQQAVLNQMSTALASLAPPPLSRSSSPSPGSPAASGSDPPSRSAVPEAPPALSLDDVVGLDEAKKYLKESFLQRLTHPDIYQALAIPGGSGLLLYGPPGTGKTFLGKAIAASLEAEFVYCTAGELLDKYLGGTAQNIRNRFAYAREHRPAVLFLDEIDALCLENSVAGNASRELLTELDGIGRDNSQLLVIGATNRPWVLPPALTRTGRLGELLFIPLPTEAERALLLEKAFRTVAKAADVDFRAIASATERFSGADLVNSLAYRAKIALANESIATGAAQPPPLTQAILEQALAESKASTTSEQLALWDAWNQKHSHP